MLARAVVWSLALIVVILSARYFLDPVPWLPPPFPEPLQKLIRTPADFAALDVAPKMYANHPRWLLTHIGAAIAAMLLGLFQFIAAWRAARPRVHRILGTLYVAAVLIAGIASLPMPLLSLAMMEPPLRGFFIPGMIGFLSLGVVWIAVTLLAWRSARARRYEEHRAWMLRSYCLTYGAVTVRLVAPLITLAAQDATLGTNAAILSWPINLLIAEWLIRRRQPSLRMISSTSL